MLSTDDVAFFSRVARSASLAAASRSLGVSAPAVSQRLRSLEARLGVRLIDRSTRHLRLTEEGRLLLERGESLLKELGQITDALKARQQKVSGHLRVAASFGFGMRFVAPVVAQFRRIHAEVTVELVLSENPSRIGSDSWDVMVHVGPLKDSRLIAKFLASNRRIACVSPSYIRRRGIPAVPEELADHECIALEENDEDSTLWRFTRSGSAPVGVRIEPVMGSNSGEAVHAWALAGLGVIVRSEWDVAEDLREGRLVELLPDWQLPSADVAALVSSRAGQTARSRRFMALLEASLNPPPWRPRT